MKGMRKMSETKWHMHRFGLVDFWLYTNEEFYFSNGHMLLRGFNGSGKSITLQSCIPLLLDGNRSSERIDTFGSRDRKIDTYLIEADSNIDERIGYLYLEFKKGKEPVYTTIGIGLRARKNKPLESWYFVIEDNRRINRDIMLTKKGLTLTKKELRFLIGSQLIEQQKVYMEKVNQTLFGFETTEEYKEAIDLLLQVRRPKLSNDFKPTLLNDILSQSLQPLSEDDLRPMSEAITNMDDIKDQLDNLKINIDAAHAIANEYNAHCYYTLYKKFDLYEQEEKKLQKQQKELKLKKERIEEINLDKLNDEKQNENLIIEKQLLEEERAGLVNEDVLAKQQALERLEAEIKATIEDIDKKEGKYQSLDNRLLDKQNDAHKLNKRADEIYSNLNDTMKEMDDILETVDFIEHANMKHSLYENIKKDYDFSYSKEVLLELLEKVQKGKALFYQLHAFQSQKTIVEDALEHIRDEKEEKDAILLKAQHTYQEVLTAYKENFITWSYGNTYLKWSDEKQKAMIDLLLQYEQHHDYRQIHHKIDTWYKEVSNKETSHLMYMQEQLRLQKEQLEIQEREIEVVRNQKEIAPEIDAQARENRKQLRDLNIAFQPFYTLIEFANDLDDASKNHYEMLFTKTQMLNALLVEEKDRKTLLSNNMNIDNYLFVDQDVTNIKSYELQKQTSSVDLQKHFKFSESSTLVWDESSVKFGFVTTKLSDEKQAIYIGVEAREKHRKQTLELLSQEYEHWKIKVEETSQEVEHTKQALQVMEQEYQAFPKEEQLNNAYQKIKDCEDTLKVVIHTLSLQSESLLQLVAKMKPIMQDIAKIAEDLNIGNKSNDFDELDESLKDYQLHLQRFADDHQKYVNACAYYQQAKEQVEDLHEQLDEVQGDLQSKKQLEIKQEGQIAILKDQLEQMGIQEIQIRLNQISERIKVIESIQIKLNQNFGRYVSEIEILSKEIIQNDQELIKQEEKRSIYKSVLDEEIKLGYMQFDDHESLRKQLISSKQENHDALMKQGSNLQRFNEVFMSRQAQLADYNLTYRTIEVSDQFNDLPLRLYVFAKYAGKQLSFFELLNVLDADIIEQEQILKDSDRQLFEDILINTISSKVKHKIHQSRTWVEKMNNYMQAMNTSSSLKLKLIWKQKKAEDDNQLNVSELVELLERDATVLKERDLNRISRHFRSKIDQARKLSTSEGNLKSFHQIMKEILDYRTWFEFVIIYDKESIVHKELTNKVFGTFSGGEKAMSMYIPMFSAVVAKFSNGYASAPSIISLDEAFAGVDERNNKEMFELIEKFGFDYIMSSQSLWGDYPSVSALSIYELHRKIGEKYVTILHYHWNGLTREYLVENKE